MKSTTKFSRIILGVLLLVLLAARSAKAQSVPAPILTPPSNSAFVTVTPITVSDTGSGVTIHYTTDGIDPTQGDPTITSGSSINIGAALTLKACAWNVSGSASAVTSGTYQITGLIDGGSYHAVAIDFSGKLWAWGNGTSGRTGDGSTANANELYPGRVYTTSTSTFDNAVYASGGNGHSLAVDSSGNAWSFGENANSELGNNSTTDSAYAIRVLTGTNATSYLTGIESISAGFNFSEAVATSGTVWAWGQNTDGRTGIGVTTGNQEYAVPVLSTTNTLNNIVEVSTGYDFSVALDGTGGLWVWGNNNDGMIGTSGSSTQPKAIRLTGTNGSLGRVTDIATGWEHGMAVVWDGTSNQGTVWCWGEQANGRLGNGQNANAAIKTPVKVTCTNGAILSNIVQVAAGPRHSLALDGTGGVWAWGYNATGDLGDGSTGTCLNAEPISLPETILNIGAGGLDNLAGTIQAYSYAIGKSGTFYAWGFDQHGELADGNTTTNLSPEATAGSEEWLDIPPAITNPLGWSGQTVQPASITLSPNVTAGNVTSVSFYENSSLLGTDTIGPFTWSLSNLQQGSYVFSAVATDAVGASAEASVSISVPLPTVTGTTLVSSAIVTSGTGEFKISRNGPTTNSIPVTYTVGGTAVSGTDYVGLSGTLTLGVGQQWQIIYVIPIVTRNFTWSTRDVSLAITGTGYNIISGTSDITLTNLLPIVQPVLNPPGSAFLKEPVVIVTDTDSAATIRYTTNGTAVTSTSSSISSGSLVQLGSSGTLNSVAYKTGYPYSYTTSGTYTGVAQLSAGAAHSLALKGDGSLWSWGCNGSGRLGIGNLVDQWNPVSVGISGTVISISAGSSHSLAVTSDGNVWGWGDNTGGKAGGGSGVFSILTPIAVTTGTSVVSAASGGVHSVALTSGSAVIAWGYNNYGELGNGTQAQSYTPVTASGISNIIAVAAGTDFSVALKSDGTVWAWGNNTYDVCGYNGGFQTTPYQVSGVSNIVAIAAGDEHILALKSDGTVWAWGANSYGQLGNSSSGGSVAAPAQVKLSSGYLSNIIAISAGVSYSIAVKSDGTVWAWGLNDDGQLGTGNTTAYSVATEVSGISAGLTVAAGHHSLVAISDGSVASFGLNGNGQLALGNTTSSVNAVTCSMVLAQQPMQPTFSPDGGFYTASQLVTVSCTSGSATIMYTTDGSLPSLTGTDSYSIVSGQTVNVTGPTILRARAFQTGQSPSSVKSSVYHMGYQMLGSGGHSILMDGSGNVYTWGSNQWVSSASGALGLGWTGDDQVYPQKVTGLPAAASAVGAGPYNSAAVIRSGSAAGTIWAWGVDNLLQCGTSTSPGFYNSPVQVPGVNSIVGVACGLYHMVALSSSGTVITWGADNDGQLGNGTTETSATATTVSGLANVVQVAAGDYHTVALTGGGAVYSWGANNDGQLGYSTVYSSTSSPTAIPTLTGIVAISVAGSHNFALKNDGTVWAWGDDSGDLLGDTLNSNETIPVCVGSLRDVVEVETGIDHTVAIKGDGSVWAWGSNGGDALGQSTGGTYSLPVSVPGLSLSLGGTNYQSTVTAVSAGYHSLAVMNTDGVQTLWAWGQNGNGELGDGTLTTRYTPEVVQFGEYTDSNNDGLPDWLALELGLNPTASDPSGIPYGILYEDGLGLNPTFPYSPYQLPAGDSSDHTPPTIYVTIPSGATLQ